MYDGQRLNTDGTPMMATVADEDAERAVAAQLEAAWHCDLRKFGPLTPIDFYGLRDGRLVCVVEVRCVSARAADYPTAMLNVRKWLALNLARVGLGVSALWVVRFADGVRWVHVQDVDGTAVQMFRKRVVRVASDEEPCIAVPIAQMQVLS